MANDFKVGGIDNLCADIDANGEYIYIAALNSSDQPQVIKISTALDLDGTIEFDPGAGTEINVKCGRLENDKVWVSGDFGSSTVVLFDGRRGYYWKTDFQSPYWDAPAKPLHVGPDDDDLVIAFTPDDNRLYQSYFISDYGPYWFLINNTLPIDVNAVDRRITNVDEILIGVNYWYSGENTVMYSPDEGFYFEDLSGLLSTNGQKITSIIFI